MHRFRSIVALLLLGLLLTAGCSTTPLRTPTNVTDTAGPTDAVDLRTIRVSYVRPVDPKLDAIVAAFSRQHPDVRVELVPFDNVHTALQAKVKAGDVGLFRAWGVTYGLAQHGLVADLQPYIQKSGLDTRPFEPLYPELQILGRWMELPYAVDPVLLVVNKDLARARGVSLPAESWTWEEFRAAAAQLTHTKGDMNVWGFAADLDTLVLPRLQVAQAAGTPKAGDSVETSLRFLAEMVGQEIAPVPIPRDAAPTPDPDYFRPGQAGMSTMTLNEWLGATNNQRLPFEWAVLPWPAAPGARPVTYVELESYALAEASPYKEDAWALLHFMVGPEGALAVARAGYLPYLITPEARKAFLAAHPDLPPAVAAAVDATRVTSPTFRDPSTRSGALWLAGRYILAQEKTLAAQFEQAARLQSGN